MKIDELLKILFGNPQNIPKEPATDTDITHVQQELGLLLPSSYVQFLKTSNGLDAYQTEHIFGTKGDEGLVKMRQRMGYLPSNLLAFFHGEGGSFCFFDTSDASQPEFPVMRQRLGQQQVERTHDNFTAWLEGFIRDFEQGLR